MADQSPDSEQTAADQGDCLFCRIIDGEIPATKVTETATVLAFRDIQPQAPTHVLIIPKRHVPNAVALAMASATELQAVFEVAGRVAVEEGLAQGYRLVANTGPHAQQSVEHAHFHLVGGRQLQWPPG